MGDLPTAIARCRMEENSIPLLVIDKLFVTVSERSENTLLFLVSYLIERMQKNTGNGRNNFSNILSLQLIIHYKSWMIRLLIELGFQQHLDTGFLGGGTDGCIRLKLDIPDVTTQLKVLRSRISK